MISCTEFIPAYSEGFRFIEKIGGRAEVEKFWAYLSDNYLRDSLRKLVLEHGLDGCFIYWEKALNEEAADFRMTLDEDKGVFHIEMYRCPSKARLIELEYMKPYGAYCSHCPALYGRALEPLGYEYSMDLTMTGVGRCSATIKKK